MVVVVVVVVVVAVVAVVVVVEKVSCLNQGCEHHYHYVHSL